MNTTATKDNSAPVTNIRSDNPARSGGWWRIFGLIGLAIVLVAPVIAVLASFFSATDDTQGHIWATNGWAYLTGTLGLCLFVGAIAGGLGTLSAALVSLFDFPGRRILSFALIVPFAVPAYIMAYAYGSFLSPFGGLSELVIAVGGSREMVTALPTIRSFWGGVLILSLSVYPYVYLAVRADLMGRSASYLEAARGLGAAPIKAIARILIPATRTAFLGGLALALMETAADFGVSDYFGIRTLTTGIFRTWYGLGDLTAAAQIAGGLFLVAALLILIEELARKGSVAEPARGTRAPKRLPLSTMGSLGAILLCALPVLLGFILPVGILIHLAMQGQQMVQGGQAGAAARLIVMLGPANNTMMVALFGGVLVMAMGLGLAYLRRAHHDRFHAILIRIMTLGYAIPGAVIAIGILISGAFLFKPMGLSITQGGLLILIYAYCVRFLTAGYNAVHGGLSKINPLTDMAARSLGAHPSSIVRRIHVPLTHRACLAGLVIVFIDISRELPATLLLRPFNFETLATSVYRLASDERLIAAAPMALAMIMTGLIPTLFLSLLSNGKR